jgi:hypothetical protein
MVFRSARLVLVLAPMALALAPGCDGDSPTEIHSFVDSAGRSCTVDAHDISGTSTCDVQASTVVTCSSGNEAAFTIDDDYDFMTHVWTLRNCGSCVDRPNHMTFVEAPTCATITCTSNADCFHGSYTCMSGVCRHM